MKLEEISEFDLIARIRSSLKSSQGRAILGTGDDAALIKTTPGKHSLFTLDVMVENTHFKLDYFSPQDVGWKALAVNISDIAAMGGMPTYCVVGLGLCGGLQLDLTDGLCQGLKEIADHHGIGVVGGDIVRSGEFFIAISLLGEVTPGEVVSRSGAKVGDLVLVTGDLGGAAAGLACLGEPGLCPDSGRRDALVQRHLRPIPRLKEGQRIAASGIATSMIDISDGLISDLSRIREESKVGAVLWEERIPIISSVRDLACSAGRSALDWALSGGEDYELLFTVAPDKSELLEREMDFPVSIIGEVIEWEKGIVLRNSEGRRRRVEAKGYDHLV